MIGYAQLKRLRFSLSKAYELLPDEHESGTQLMPKNSRNLLGAHLKRDANIDEENLQGDDNNSPAYQRTGIGHEPTDKDVAGEVYRSKQYLTDTLTGLPNRRHLEEEIDSKILSKYFLVIIYVPTIYDIAKNYSYISADELTITVSRRIRSVLHKGDFLARIDDEEFAIFIRSEIASDNGYLWIKNRIKESLSYPIKIYDEQIVVNLLVSHVISNDENVNSSELIRKARNSIRNIVKYEQYIDNINESKEHIIKGEISSEEWDALVDLMQGGLHASFDKVGFPVDSRREFATKVADDLLQHARSKASNLVPAEETEDAKDSEFPSSPYLQLPTEAPTKWKDREPGETAPDFARRVYGPYGIANGIPKQALRSLDAALVNELNTWVREGKEMPADIKVLTVREENDRLLAAGPEAIYEHLGKFTGAEAAREAARLRAAQIRRD